MYDGSSNYDAGAVPPREAVQQGLHDARDLHDLAVQGTEPAAERRRHRCTRSASPIPTCRTASCSTASTSCRSAAIASWGANTNAIVNGIIGNWSVSAWWNWQSGRANLGDFNGLGNVYYNGDINQLTTDFSGDVSQPVFDTRGFYFNDAAVQTNGQVDPAKQRADTRIQLVNNLRTLPTRPEKFRGPTYTNVDMSFVKRLDFGRIRAQFHFELYNALNDVFYNNPNLDPRSSDFGKVPSQNNLPRNFQIGMKVLF